MEALLREADGTPPAVDTARCSRVLGEFMHSSSVARELMDRHGLRAECLPCATTDVPGRAIFYRRQVRVVVCSDRMARDADVVEAARHELVHAHDVRPRHLDRFLLTLPLGRQSVTGRLDGGTCGDLACSEVRACALVDCRGALAPTRCIRRCASRALAPSCPSSGSAAVEEVLEQCMLSAQDVPQL